jgi:hypothetical protein
MDFAKYRWRSLAETTTSGAAGVPKALGEFPSLGQRFQEAHLHCGSPDALFRSDVILDREGVAYANFFLAYRCAFAKRPDAK